MGLLLFLPVLLVLFLAGTARTEEESSLGVDASNLLPAGEKVAVREAREAGIKQRNEGNNKKSKLGGKNKKDNRKSSPKDKKKKNVNKNKNKPKRKKNKEKKK